MLTIVCEVKASGKDAQGIKERIAADLERYGDVRVVRITSDEKEFKQLSMGDKE